MIKRGREREREGEKEVQLPEILVGCCVFDTIHREKWGDGGGDADKGG